MKILFTLFIGLTLFLFNSHAQETQNIYQTQIDSVQTLLTKLSKSDTLRVIELNRLARLCIYDLQYEKGLSAASEARTVAKKINYPQGEGMYFRTLDVLHYEDQNNATYHTLATWSFKDAKKAEYPITIKSTGKINTVKSTEALETAAKELEKAGNEEMAAHAFYMLSLNYKERRNLENALKNIEKAESIFAGLKLDIPLIQSKILKATILKTAGRDSDVRKEELELARISEVHNHEPEKALLYADIGLYYFWNTQQIDISLDYALKAISIFEKFGDKNVMARYYFFIGSLYQWLDFPQKSVEFFAKSFELINSDIINDSRNEYWLRYFYNWYPLRLIDVGDYKRAEEIIAISKSFKSENERLPQIQGALLMAKGQYNEALEMFYDMTESRGIKRGEPDNKDVWNDYYIANCLNHLGKLKESNRFALASYQQAIKTAYRITDAKKACLLLYENYEKMGETNKALEYLKIYFDWVKKEKEQDISSRAAKTEIQAVIDKSEQEKKILEQEKMMQEKANQNQRWWLFSIAAGLFSSLLVVYLLMRNNKNKQEANVQLQKQKNEINHQKDKAEKALIELKSTQAQLIQSEKMASLGELTAGIAHEIQNPLNFVNNFSEVSNELIDEMKEEFKKGDIDEGFAIADDIKQNLEKINHHGKRADTIVKGMLQHSRTSSGQKELTDINALADEYLRLAYHGLRAKDKSFNADFRLDADESIPKINVIPQDIGRVLLNLINNAFYACAERSRSTVNEKVKHNVNDYKPMVVVNTSLSENKVEITVHDNGNGVPESVKEKIFQPFFTTKPTGQGTGLGLSLSYDIVKAHGGSIQLKSQENVGTEFIIHLPLS